MLKFNNIVLKYDGKWLFPVESIDFLPPNTVRVRTSDGNPPVKGVNTEYETATLVPGTTDIYDVYKSGTYFGGLLYRSSNVIEVLGANTSNVTNTQDMFKDCRSLTSVALFDTSNVTNMAYMFDYCDSLTSVPLFNTSKVIYMERMFGYCYNVQSGALALYQQASTQANPPTYYTYAFHLCGRDTVTGAAELAQIPSSWK